MTEKYSENLLRFVAATIHVQLLHSAAKDMFGIPFYKLSLEERQSVANAVNNQIAADMLFLNPDVLKKTIDPNAPANPMGFQVPPPAAPK
jgi:hypothetical protein